MNRDTDSYRHLSVDQILKKIIQLDKEIQKSTPIPASVTEKYGITLSNFETQPLDWLWQQRILRGNLTILDGDPGLGKSLLALDLAARITAGKPMPGDTPGPTDIQGSVILIAPEDAVGNTIKPRIEAAGGDPSRILLLTAFKNIDPATGQTAFPSFTLPKHVYILADTIKQTHAILVIIDPLMAVLAPGINVFRDQNIRQVLAPLALVAQATNCAILLVRHLNKGSSDNPLYRGSGSIGIIGSARAGLLVTPDPYDENKRILATTKNNLSAPAPNLTYQIIANAHGVPTIQWLGTNHLPVTSLLRRSTVLSPERQAILNILKESSLPLGPKAISERTGQDYESVRQTLRRMHKAQEIISPAYGLYGLYGLYSHYTTPQQPSSDPSVPANSAVTPVTPVTVTQPESHFDLPTTPLPPDLHEHIITFDAAIPENTLATLVTPVTVSHPDSNFALLPNIPVTAVTPVTVSHSDSNFALLPTTPVTPVTVSHPDSNFDAAPPAVILSAAKDLAHEEQVQLSRKRQTIEQLSLLLGCRYTIHHLFWIFTPQKIGCPNCDTWSTREAAHNPATLALYAAISQYPPHESPSMAAWIELITPSLGGL